MGKGLLQRVHWYRFSPVCNRKCLLRQILLLNVLSQYVHFAGYSAGIVGTSTVVVGAAAPEGFLSTAGRVGGGVSSKEERASLLDEIVVVVAGSGLSLSEFLVLIMLSLV